MPNPIPAACHCDVDTNASVPFEKAPSPNGEGQPPSWAANASVRPTMTPLRCEIVQAIRYLHADSSLVTDQRRSTRYPYPCAIDLWPVENGIPLDQRIVVIGKNISLGGIAFFHHQPIPHRHVVLGLTQESKTWLYLLAEVNWCRFLRDGWYDGGGRFLKPTSDPRELWH